MQRKKYIQQVLWRVHLEKKIVVQIWSIRIQEHSECGEYKKIQES